jgi:hypothetical protein
MRGLMLTLLLFAFVALLQGQGSAPSVSVISQLQCDSNRFAVLQISNSSGQDSIFFPLSPLYTQGYTVHNIMLEVEESGQWRLVGRGSDIPPTGVRELKPGERFLDLFQLPTSERAATLASHPMRLIIPYKVGASYEQVKTKDFMANELHVKSDVACPNTLNAK